MDKIIRTPSGKTDGVNQRRKRRGPPCFFIVVAIFLSLCLTLLSLEGLLRILVITKLIKPIPMTQPVKNKLCQYDKELGWKNSPGFNEKFEWPHRTTYEIINRYGERDKDYPYVKPENVFRIAVIGCSRTYGYGVNMEETYPKILENMLNEELLQKFEVINFGVNGYGLDQMVINYLINVHRYSPDLVLLQLYMPSIYRMTTTDLWGLSKPTFVLKDNELQLINFPVPKSNFIFNDRWLVENSYLYKSVKIVILKIGEAKKEKFHSTIPTNKYVYKLCTTILSYLNNRVSQKGSKLIVFIWGNSKWLEKMLEEAKVEYFVLENQADIREWEKQGNIDHPPPISHWSPNGHHFVTKAIYTYLVGNKRVPDNREFSKSDQKPANPQKN